MFTPVPLWKKDPIEYLIRRRFLLPSWFNDSPDGVRVKSNRSIPAETLKLVESYRSELSEFSADTISKRVEEEREKEAQEIVEAKRQQEASRFYNQPNAQADFTFWAKVTSWTVDEAIALSLGKDPRVVTWTIMKTYTELWPIAKSFGDLKLIFQRAIEAGQIYPKTLNTLILAWFDRVQIDYPKELREAIIELGPIVADWKSLYEQSTQISETLSDTIENYKLTVASLSETITSLEQRLDIQDDELDERERATLLKLVFGMARAQYGYEPQKVRSETAKQIMEDLDDLGLKLSAKTIRKYLAEGADRYDGGET